MSGGAGNYLVNVNQGIDTIKGGVNLRFNFGPP
jgi:hypothetical protein